MKWSIPLRTAPSVRQTNAILARLAEELDAAGAGVTRPAPGTLRFRMPVPWRARRPGALLAITAGTVAVRAGRGGPWRVSYELHFLGLQVTIATLSGVLLVLGWSASRLGLIGALLVMWGLLYALPFYLAARRFHRLVRASARHVVERRRTPRPRSAPPSPGHDPPATPNDA